MDEKTRTIAIVGAGGINSWSAKYLREMINTFYPETLVVVKIFDRDIVEEKNIKRNSQNFTIEDLLESKSNVLAKRYNFIAEEAFIDEKNINELASCDDVIIGVDNHKTRKLIYEFCIKNGIYCLDLRAQGTRLSYFVLNPLNDDAEKQKLINDYNARFFSNPEVLERQGSCQLAADIENDHIENANKAIAYFGMFCIYLKRWRNEELSTNEFEFVY